MKKIKLATGLRKRQIADGMPRALIKELSDDDIIDSYTHCYCCQCPIVDADPRCYSSVEDFEQSCDVALAEHQPGSSKCRSAKILKKGLGRLFEMTLTDAERMHQSFQMTVSESDA